MAHPNGSADTFEKHQHELCNAFARVAAAMRDAAQTAESFSNWFSRVNNTQNLVVPPMFNNGPYPFLTNFPGPQQQQPYQPISAPSPEQTSKKRRAAGDLEGTKKKRQAKEKKPKDVNAPKRPPSAYILFQNEVRKEVQTQHPDVPYNQILTEISKMWKEMTPKEKEPYVQATADSKVLYEKAKADYESHSPTTETSTKPAEPKSKSQVPAATAVTKPTSQATTSSEEESSSTPTSEESSSDDDDEDEEKEKTPEPESQPKKSKKVPKAPTPPPAKVEKKKSEGKKKKKSET